MSKKESFVSERKCFYFIFQQKGLIHRSELNFYTDNLHKTVATHFQNNEKTIVQFKRDSFLLIFTFRFIAPRKCFLGAANNKFVKRKNSKLYFWPFQRSEFESRWSLQFFCKIELEKNENKEKESGLAHFFKKNSVLFPWILLASIFLCSSFQHLTVKNFFITIAHGLIRTRVLWWLK